MKRFVLFLCLCLFSVSGFSQLGNSPYSDWTNSGSFFIITTAEGADLPESSIERDFPILLRLNSDFFVFEEAKSDGTDLRFSSVDGHPLSYQIEEWDAINGKAGIWIRVPVIRGNERQEIKVYWGNQKAKNEASGSDVFNKTNGFISVWHLNEQIKDEVGTVKSKDNGSVLSEGIIGTAREFANGSYIDCGDNITSYPSGSEQRTTSAWICANKPGWAVDWGMEARCQENSIKLDKPPVVKNEGYLCDVFGSTEIEYREWNYVSITYNDRNLVLYLNGREDGRSERDFVTPDISYMRIGKRHNSGDNPWERQWWDGAIDEVRISNVARSEDWIKLEYENQNRFQSLVGPIVKDGDYFTVSEAEININEGGETTVLGAADGAQKILWLLQREGNEEIVAVDQLSYTFKAGRVRGDQNAVLFFKAIYPDGVKLKEIPVNISEGLPDPVFELSAPVKWNGRDTIEVAAIIGNLDQLNDYGAAELHYNWKVSDVAVSSKIVDGKMILSRAQNSGMLRIKLSIDNGGLPVSKTIAIKVEEPLSDPWLERIPGPNEKAQNNQFYARGNDNYGTVFYNGRLKYRADSVILKIFAGKELYYQEAQKPGRKKSYAFTAKIEAGLVEYRIELWSKKPKDEKLVEKAINIVCGDAYIIDGQSNAEAYDYGKAVNPYRSTWVRSYGSSSSDPKKSSLNLWGKATSFDKDEAKFQIGYWGIELAKNLVMRYKIPICIINGAVGGSRIDQHQRNNDNPEDPATIYGRLLRRVNEAGLSHGIRGVIWHQGENDQGADGPDPGYGWETYQQYFVNMAAAWKEDYPNIQQYYMFQIWPDACSMGKNGSGDHLREVQRTLPALFSNLKIMSTLGIRPGGGCHFPPEGYAEMADLIIPLIEQDNYGVEFEDPVSPPNLEKAYFTSERRDVIAIEFDQPMDWDNSLISEFYLDGEKNWIVSGSLWGEKILLKLKGRSDAKKISYLDGKNWDENNILYGRNGIAALTFYEVPLLSMDAPAKETQSNLERSSIEQPYPYIGSGGFLGNSVPESPDPLVAYRWPDPKASDGLEIFVLKPEAVDTDSPASFENLSSLLSDQALVTVKGTGSIRIDFGLEMPAWIEFDSEDCPGGIEMSISEYNQPGVNKTAEPKKYNNTYRLELNAELYDGVRFAWIHVNSYSSEWHITDVRAVNQVKPTNYNGSFSCSDQTLTQAWYMSAYSVKASMCKDYFGAIIMDRGDRMSWTGDAHPIQAASLVAFGNYDFVKKNIENTSSQSNGIRSYSLYWVLSLLDYYKYSGDIETLEKYIVNASNKLDDAYIEFGTDPNLRFYGWDERLTAGFELWFMPAPEAQRAYKMLTIRAWLDFAEVMKEIGRADLDSKYSWYARRKIEELRTGPDWFREYGLHASADAVNTKLLSKVEHDSIYMNVFVNRVNRLSLSPFNQYFIIQALANMKKYDDALSTVRDIWGGMILNGATTPYEVFRPSWNEIVGKNDPVPNSQSGIVSLCHPWGAGPVKWLNEVVLGIKPGTAGFKTFEILPHPGRTIEWFKGTTPTPYGDIRVNFDLLSGNGFISTPAGTSGRFGIPKVERSVKSISINGQLAWEGAFKPVDGIASAWEDNEFVYFESVQAGDYVISTEYLGKSSFYVEPHPQYPAGIVAYDSLTSGNWGGKYGKDGYILCNYYGDANDIQFLPSYVDSISYFRAFPKSEGNRPEPKIWEKETYDIRALAPTEDNDSLRVASCYSNTDQTMTFTVNLNRKRKYQIALYFVDWNNDSASQAVEMFDANTLNLISPVKMVDDFAGGKYLVFTYSKSVKFRINRIRGERISLSGIFFDPID